MNLRPLAVTAAVAVLALAGCASPSSEDSEAATEEAGAVVVHDDLGETTIPEPPERIVTLVDYGADLLAAFDRVPVAAQVGTGGTRPAYLGEAYAEVPSVGAYAEPSLEAILEQDPDLIIAIPAAHQDLRDQLMEIAPTVMWEPQNVDDVLDQIDEMGRILGEPEKADEVATGLSDAMAAAGDNADASCVIAMSGGGGAVELAPRNSLPASVIGEFCDYAYEEDGESNSVESSVEALADIDADYVFFSSYAGDDAALKDLEQDPLWSQVRAAEDDHVVSVDPTVWLFGRGPTAIRGIIDDASAALAE